jgi:N-hydroxyarylamine O-acetyltransferase
MHERLSANELRSYLARIGIDRPPRADAAALAAIHRAHAHAFTWENLDAYRGWPSTIDPGDAFAKMVDGGRGGWCYEMNGLLGAALAGFGFAVTRLAGGVGREQRGDAMIGNHLTLRVDLDTPWLADVGLGDAIVDPLPLAFGRHQQGFMQFAIDAADGWWRFRNHPAGGAQSFDFRPDYGDEVALAASQAFLVGDQASPFVNNLVVQRHYPGRIETLRNRTRATISAAGVVETPVADAAALARTLAEDFRIAVPDVDALWDKLRRGPATVVLTPPTEAVE